ncbi:exopolyphosphatase/guanosine-5'-triphosphate,3'-diphosphate pyrophosphatase [Methanolinea mesophila]|uniref:Ppx/GppA phosphatase family protein n=1 Tax=Methanolinea mesophila TaxID=547055 RepID=UPI001AE6770C|nr:Ppx/GppA phosphatase family protein [Methanolinea mesophila]MBP1928102.1 exopolyphosphatase/guanosine-5'-triphosphate,3'-diphosphate pyrophosphatase [Methanolinea mesophila]
MNRSPQIPPEGRVVTFIDLGTNSIRVLVVRLFSNCTSTVLSRQKEVIRLGEGEFDTSLISEAAMDRAVTVCRRFVEMARSFGTEEYLAVATSATREARNQNILLSRLRHESGLDVRVISGREEARLIYEGVVSGTHLDDRLALLVDVGGGSTEIALGTRSGYLYLESLKLGSIRLTNLFFPGGTEKSVSRKEYERIRQHVKNEMVRPVQELRKYQIDLTLASSGTAQNLAEIAARTAEGTKNGQGTEISRSELSRVANLLCSLSLDDRRKVPGINPERADIIVCGAAILETLMEELKLGSMQVTSRGLQDGLLTDYLSRLDDFPLLGTLTVRERSVLQLGRSCGINEHHARAVARLALDLFDSARDTGIHSLGEEERELLLYATFLHDIGSFISYNNHHAHSYYLIRNAELLGFDQKEISVMAYIARFHRKKPPKKKALETTELGKGTRATVKMLSLFLRMAESLDRSHAGLVHHVRFMKANRNNEVRLEIAAVEDCQLEIWGVENEVENFSRVFGRRLVPVVRKIDLGELAECGTARPVPPLLDHSGKQ